MKTPFSKEEISIVINKLKNNKKTGRDSIKPELLNFGTEESKRNSGNIQ